MWVSMVAFWSLFAVFAFYAIKGLTRLPAAHSGPRATEILEERFAQGKVSAEEYRERGKTLEMTGGSRRE
jgi:uncharacterized membrane protein